MSTPAPVLTWFVDGATREHNPGAQPGSTTREGSSRAATVLRPIGTGPDCQPPGAGPEDVRLGRGGTLAGYALAALFAASCRRFSSAARARLTPVITAGNWRATTPRMMSTSIVS